MLPQVAFCAPLYIAEKCAVSVCFFLQYFFIFSVSCVIAQAPGDAHPICLSEMIDGQLNPFFNVHDYGPNRRALMDSKDYGGLLQGADPEYLPWQSVDVMITTTHK